MTFQTLLATLQAAGIKLRRNGDGLAVSGDRDTLDTSLLRELRTHKTALLDLIGEDGWWSPPLIRPEMLPLVELTQEEIDCVVAGVLGGAENVQDIYPLAPLQEGMLFHHLLTTEGDPYLSAALSSFDTRDRLDAYLGALRTVIARHDILRTSLAWEGLREPVQVVWREAVLPVEEVELDPSSDDAGRALYARFDPRRHRLDVRVAPLLRAFVARDAARGRWLLLLLQHHLVGDQVTSEVMDAEVRAHLLGMAGHLPEPLPFRNYVAQARLGVRREEHEAYFRALLGDVDEPTAPFGLLDAWGDGSGIEEARLRVDAALSERLRERARVLAVSAASVCHVAWAQVLARVSGRSDVVFGTVLFGRMQGGDGADQVMGPFINTLPVRIRIGGEGAEAGVRAAHRQLTELMRHEHASLALAQRGSGVRAPAPLFTSLMNYRRGGGSGAPRAPLEGVRGVFGGRSNYPVTLSVNDLSAGLDFKAKAPASVGAARVCALMHQALEGLLDALETAPARPLARVDVLPGSERAQVVETWNATDAEVPADACIHHLFEAQAARTPDAAAVTFEGAALSYDALNRRANRLAHHLIDRGVGPDVRVGVCVERSPDLAVALLAVLKAGGAYVPLDPEYPEDRLRYMLSDAAPAVLLTESSLRDRFDGLDAPAISLDADADAWVDASNANPECVGVGSDHLAYVIYTSGSTGRPKGVMNLHRGLVNRLVWGQRAWNLGADEAVLLKTSLSFDGLVRELFWPLMTGARVVVARPGGHRDPAYLLETIRAEGIGTINLVPSMLQVLLEDPAFASCRNLKRILCGGEALPAALIGRFRERMPEVEIHNLYGPSEAATALVNLDCDGGEGRATVPVGRPVANTRVYVLDAGGEPVPAGVAGELYIGGAGVSRGYLGRPEMTAERFVADPFSGGAGARLYRTGDLARWLPDGSLEFLGRNDHQVKVRGFRIELGEIEAALTDHPEVRESVVAAREDAPGDRRLVAYYAASEAIDVDALRAHLSDRLPEYMVPAAYVHLSAFPRTPNGKLDRAALPAPEGGAYAQRGYEAPAGPAEEALAEIWAALLGVERVGRRDHFFELGGHSLLAVQLLSRVRQALGVEVPLREVFERPVLAELARGLTRGGEGELPPIEPADRGGRLALSFAQQRLWFLERLGGVGSAYHVPRRLRLKGALDREALARALDRILARHEVLRTTFAMVDGEPEQRIAPVDASRFTLLEHDLAEHPDAETELRRLMAEEAKALFDLERGPLIRGRLVRMGEDDHVLMMTMHHVVSDEWSMGVLVHELSVLYDAFRAGAADPLPPLPVQYADYAAWQRRWVDGELLRRQADFWKRTLSGAPELLDLPTDRPRPAQRDHAGAVVGVELDAGLTAALKELCRRNGTTLYMTIMAAWATVLGRLAGQDDVVVGTPTASRGRREIEGLIGFFVNTLAVRVDLSARPTAAEVMARVKAQALAAQAHQDIPFEQVVELVQPVRSTAHSPLFQVNFTWQNTPRGRLALPGLTPAPLEGVAHATAKVDLLLLLREAEGRIVGGVEYATALFDRATVERWLGYLRRVLEEMAADEHRPIDRLPMLPDEERRQVVETWNDTEAAYPSASCLHELIEAQAERKPDALALGFDGGALTYAELNARSNRLAHHLVARGVGPDVRVGISAQRGPEMVIAMLAVMKAGGAYVPLDPSYPEDRLRYMLADSAPAVLLTESSLAHRLDGIDVPVVALDADQAAWANESDANPGRRGLTPGHLAYVIYTSGSTGLPKGVMVAHRGACNLVEAQGRTLGVEPGSRVLQFASFSFDACVFEIAMALCQGVSLHLPAAGSVLAGETLIDLLDRESITHVTLPPAVLATLSGDVEMRSVRTMVLAGDVVTEALARRWAGGRRTFNAYGPTEATVWATLQRCWEDEEGNPSIGSPIANARVYVLGRAGEPVPVGVAGELYVGGAGVARGYLNRPELTAERFVADPFSFEPGARLYRTGDLARWRADGTLDFIGRTDHQVKVRGYRIELGEIEARLAEHPSVRDAVVVAREDMPGDKRLVAYVVGDSVDAETLSVHLAGHLPEYMVPAAYVRLDALPLTPNGKLDRKALPAPEGDAFARGGYEAPVGEVETAIAEIWQEMLGVERVGRRDDFFELGGYSLLAVMLVEEMSWRGLHAEVNAVFATPTLAELAATVDGESAAATDVPPNAIPAGCELITPEMLPLVELTQAEIDRVVADVPGGARNVQDVYPLAPLQEGMLFHHLLATDTDPYLSGTLSSFDTRERLDAYLDALRAVVARHDILRTSVAWEGLREPVQVVWREAALEVEDVELDASAGDAARRLWERFDPRRVRLDVRRAPLMRGYAAWDAGRGSWLLLLLKHHLALDHMTQEVVQQEVQAFLHGRADELPAPLPFRGYMAQARQGMTRDDHEAYFRELLEGVDEPTAPFGLVDAWSDGLGVEDARTLVDAGLSARLRERARALGVSAASVCHVAWAQVLARVSGKGDVVFGTVLFGRMQGGEGASRVMGPFINTLPVRIRVGARGAESTVRAAHRQLAELMRHEHASLALAQRCSAVEAPAPLFTALLNYRHSASAAPAAAATRAREGMRRIFGQERTNYPVTLAVDDLGEAFGITAQVPASVGAKRVVALVSRALEVLVETLEEAPLRALSRVEVLPESERRQLIEEWNATKAAYPADSRIHVLFEAQAEKTPDAAAVAFEGEALTYAELSARSNRLARHLIARGVGPDVRVGVCVERGVEMMVGLLGVLKAGGAYVPLDPAYPEDRLRYVLGHSAPALLLTQDALRDRFAGIDVPALALDADAASWADLPETNPRVEGQTPDHLAYVIYTSGSTGTPKGVMNTQRGVVNLLSSLQRDVAMAPGDRLLAVTTLSFDISVLELFLPLVNGARVEILGRAAASDPIQLQRAIGDGDGAVLQATPATWRLLLDGGWAGAAALRALCGGEGLPAALAIRIKEQVAALWNVYGPTETTIWSSAFAVDSAALSDRGHVSIGGPLANTRFYVLDAGGGPVPVGVAGELYIGGTGVARGYLGRPDLTAERFVPDAFSADAGARLYRTGDLARWRADGTVEFLGRNDHQVKVRGYRIELGEIEARLAEHASVREAVVMAREDAPGETRLVAYYVAYGSIDAEALRAHLADRLPEYMVPAAYVHLGALPLTPNGKLDRKALPAPEGGAFTRRGYEAPAGETETALAGVWADVLRVERVGRWDHFFELGGHSLLAVQVISRVRQALGVEVPLGQVFDHPVLAELARAVDAAGRAELPPIEPADRSGPLPLSFAQARLWFLERLVDLGATYHLPARLRLKGDLDRSALSRALNRIVERHEALRTTFVVVDGVPEQRIVSSDESAFHLAEHDLAGRADAEAELRRGMVEEAGAPFDLERGPLVRGRLIRLADDDHVLLLTMHHIVSDAWSVGVLVRELGALYGAFTRGEGDPLPALPVQYADYAAWQRRWVDGEVLEAQAAYWTRTLSGAPELLELPTDHPRPAQQDFAGATLGFDLGEALSAELKALGQRHGATLFMTLLAGWSVVLARLSGQDDVVIGTPTANRGQREVEGLIGFFVNTLAVRVALSDAPTVSELLARVKTRALESQANQDIPFEQVVERVSPTRSLAHSPLFQVLFAWQNAPRDAVELPGLQRAGLPGAGAETAKFDLSLTMQEADGRIVGTLTYATSLFERATIERHVAYLRRALEAMVADERRAVSRLPLLDESERRQVVEAWNATDVAYPRELCIHELFAAQVERIPDAVALVFKGEALTYAELNARANRLAHHLVARGVGPDVRVGICVERGAEMVVGLLAVLKAGGAYVPLDPEYPEDRLRYMLADSAPAVVLTQSALADRFGGTGVPVIALDAPASEWADRSEANPVIAGLTPDCLAYVIYTSGSTGQPKGVMNAHCGVVNRLLWMQDAYGLDAGDSVLQKTTFGFDVSVWEFFWPLIVGSRLVMARPGGHKDPGYLVETIQREKIATLHFVPSMLQLFLEHADAPRCTGLKRVVCSGEALPPALVARFREILPGVGLHNLYGPTEAAVDVTAWECTADPDSARTRVPLGRPISNTRMYVLGSDGEPAPVGVAGELYIGGIQVARGYLDRPELTAERFVADPFSADSGARLYRTGDLGRWLADRTLEYLGRNDHQVKVRGFRIELGEIEARLLAHSSVREAIVMAREDAAGDKRLVAYVVGDAIETENVRSHLLATLPEYMVPAAYVRLDALPLTPNGKLDRKALPAPEGDAYARRGYEAPAGETEEALAELWAELLGLERVGRHDHFFELGGHSLLAVRLTERMRRRGLHAEVRALFTTPTLAELAAAVRGEAFEAAVPENRIPAGCEAITPGMLPLVGLTHAEIDRVVADVPGGAANVQDVYPLAPLQEGMLFHHLLTTGGDLYLLATLSSFETRGALDAYLGALQAVIDRHDVLRTSVAWEGLREPVQVVWRRAKLEVEEVELDPAAADVARQLYDRFDPRRTRLDLRRAPLLRVYTAHAPDRGRWLLLLHLHHLAGDHTTLEVLQEEVRAHLAGRAHELPAPLPFRGYVAQARRGLRPEEHEAYFRALLEGVDEPTAPFGLLDAHGDGSGIEEVRMRVDADLAARLRGAARALGVSAASVCHVAWAQVLARVSGKGDVVFGTVLFGRMQGGEGADRVMGPFINTLPVRIRISADGARAGVRAAHRQLADLLRHEHASLALAQRCSAVEAPAPLFTSLLNYRHSGGGSASNGSNPRDEAKWDAGRVLHVEERTNYPLMLSVDDLGQGLGLAAQAPASVGARRICALVHRALEGLVEALETAPERPLSRVEVLPEAERRRVVEEWNATDAEYPAGACIHALFEAQADRDPSATALSFEGGALTYAELNAKANRLAHHLIARGVGPDVRVGISVHRNAEMVVALLAVLKAGGAYVPLDPAYPEDRLRHMLADSAPAALLTQASLADRFGGVGVPVIALDSGAASWADQPETNPAREGLTPDHLAYVIYTSGSTGLPKGVAIAHRSAVNLLAWAWRAFGGKGLDRTLLATSLNFDLAVFETFVPLTAGATVDVVRDALALLDSDADATLVNTVPSAMQALVDAGRVPHTVRTVNLAGEPLGRALAEAIFATTRVERVCNLYGPTETTTYSTWTEMDRETGFAPHVGRPLANTRVYILDRAGEPVPAGVAGELFIGGAGVARGYLNRPELTAERFVADPFSSAPGARVYRTGDLARWLADGNLEFLGRDDHQVKVRGFRIELGEIEAALAAHPAVREAVAVAREDVPGEKRLVAYYVAAAAIDPEALSAHLSGRLPEYMVPAAYVHLDAMPRTPNGKLDRKALPAPEGGAFARRGHEAPVGETEQALAEIWAAVLRVERVGRWDHFFELGGHSLLAVQVVSRVRRLLDVELPLGDVFERPVLADLARALAGARRAELPPIERADRAGRLPLSFAQARLWFLERLGGMGSAYHLPTRMRLKGVLDRDALTRALDGLVARHEALRTTFAVVDGEPEQRVASAEASRFHLPEDDLSNRPDAESGLRALMRDEAAAPFDLETGPLIRGRLVKLAADDHVLLVTMHHIVSDGWSMGVLVHDLSALYGAFARGEADPLPSLPVQYADYAAWERRWVEGEVLESQAAYWTETLAGAPELLELPADRPRPAQQDFTGAMVGVVLDEALTASLKALSQRHGATLFMTLLAGWSAVLARLSGQDDVVVGTPSANRGRSEIESLIGFFINTLALRIDLADSPTVAELLARVKARALAAQANPDLPFEQVVERVQPVRSLSHTPLFQVTFTWQNAPREAMAMPGLRPAPVPGGGGEETAKFDLGLALQEQGGRIVGGLTYATALFERETVERWAGYLRRALEAFAADDGARVDGLPLLSEAERRTVVEEWNATPSVEANACVHALFEVRAARAPGAVALVTEGESLTYAELDARANRLAHVLIDRGVTPEAAVGVCLEWGPELVVALLAVLKAGGVYLPLDPALPDERLAYMAGDAGLRALVTRAALAPRVPCGTTVCVDADAHHISASRADSPASAVGPANMAYLIYTSGSTGKPKGVAVEHGAAAAHLPVMGAALGITPDDRLLQFASAGFDVSLEQVLIPLLTGASVALRGPEPWIPAEFAGRARALGVTVANLPPAYWQEVAAVDGGTLPGVRLLLVGGDALPASAARERTTRLVNGYGPTETVVTATLFETSEPFAGPVAPIGRPLPGRAAYVLDAAGHPVPVGVAGELYLGGLQARGYLGRPALTAERFVPDPFSGRPGARLYRTGDRARWNARGALEFLGRTDFQVKIRGFRIELGEIEARLLAHPGVRGAVAAARDDAGDRRLVAYYVGEALEAEALRAHLAGALPEYMVPAAYVRLDAFPLTPSGKVDRRALPAPDAGAFASRVYEAPEGEIEAVVAELWAELLGVERVGRRDHFFELGGHSLLAVTLVERMRRLGLHAEVRALFLSPTLAAFAEATDPIQEIRL